MKKTYSLLWAFVIVLFITLNANAQVDVSPNPVSYTTLKDAFTAINAGTHTGTITIGISGNTTEIDSCVINEAVRVQLITPQLRLRQQAAQPEQYKEIITET